MRITVQLYTLRDLIRTPQGLHDSLVRIAEMGYAGVQFSAVGCMDTGEVSPELAREWLDNLGLVCCATHRPWEKLVADTEHEIVFHRALGCEYAAVGGAWDVPRTAADFRKFASDANEVAKRFGDAGIRFGYHNHSFEFAKDLVAGVRLYDCFLEVPNLQLEVDTYWAAYAGYDPTRLLRENPGRIECIHLKDMDVDEKGAPLMAPVGEGNLDWPSILAAARDGGTEWLIVEQDVCQRDPFDCLSSSFRHVSALV